ncbi:Uma2 family endonuclease [Actinoplanes sp. CA-142083]|uniref:Uma2 family endonuclease n=1 Tax=Actinoplanes sp. CA-142083 TaxID=3239903 RepID=UPI003D8C3E9D
MTIAPHLVGQDLIDYLLGRDDLTVDDIADLPEDLRYELIDGRLVLSPVALPIHQTISMKTGIALEEHCPDDIVVNVEQAILLNPSNEFRPDVMVFHEEGAGRSPVLAADVLLVVEVISPSSKDFDREDKLKRYADLGIPAYWIIDPLAERVSFSQFLLGPEGSYQRRLQADGLVAVDHPWEVTLDLPAWTQKRDRINQKARTRR